MRTRSLRYSIATTNSKEIVIFILDRIIYLLTYYRHQECFGNSASMVKVYCFLSLLSIDDEVARNIGCDLSNLGFRSRISVYTCEFQSYRAYTLYYQCIAKLQLFEMVAFTKVCYSPLLQICVCILIYLFWFFIPPYTSNWHCHSIQKFNLIYCCLNLKKLYLL